VHPSPPFQWLRGLSRDRAANATDSNTAAGEEAVHQALLVNVDFDNPNQAIPHDVWVQTSSGKQLGCSKQIAGGQATLDLKNLKAGSYTFYCSVDDHEAAGMKATLTVQ